MDFKIHKCDPGGRKGANVETSIFEVLMVSNRVRTSL